MKEQQVLMTDEEVLLAKVNRIKELEEALRSIKQVLVETKSESAVAVMIIATCDSALRNPHYQ